MVITPRKDLIDHNNLCVLDAITVSTDLYEIQETRIRHRMHDLLSSDPLITSITFSNPFEHDGRHCVYDAFIVSAGTEMFVEAKERSYSADRFSSWSIEDVKAKDLETLARRTKIPAMWMSISSDGKAFVWSVQSKHYVKDVRCPVKSFEPDLGWCTKSMRHYPSRTAKRFSA